MILLPNSCKCSNFSISPTNWKSGGRNLLKKTWRISYRFYDTRFPDKPEWGKQVFIKGMNQYKTLEERREATQILIEEELYNLQVNGWNPITKEATGGDVEIHYEIDPKTPLSQAITQAVKKIDVSIRTKKEIERVSKKFNNSLRQLHFDKIRLEDVKRKHVRMALDNQTKINSYSNSRYNKVRAYLAMVFKVFVQLDSIDYNPIYGISKKKVVKKLRTVLTVDELQIVKTFLHRNHYTFYRYMEIFFHSGSRSSELVNVRKKDVNLRTQTFKVLVKKGANQEEQLRAINDNVVHLWKELLLKSENDSYLFSKNLEPGPIKINEWQISKRWREHVKKKLGIQADFYSLKHLHTTRVVEHYGNEIAKEVNGHKSQRMNQEHYDVMRKNRLLEEAKRINISL